MAGFRIKHRIDENLRLNLAFDGALDEHSNYQQFPPFQGDEIVIDFDGIRHVNSTGCKLWIEWVADMESKSPEVRFLFKNIPKGIVDQMNMIVNFKPNMSTVHSFKVPYFCENCEVDRLFTYVRGREYEFTNDKLKINYPIPECGQGSCQLELDVSERKYFQFLKTLPQNNN